jgi:hypothetical protein
MHTFADPMIRQSAPRSERRNARAALLWVAVMTLVALAAGLSLLRGNRDPAMSGAAGLSLIAWIIYLGGVAAIFREPRHGVYLILFFTLISDNALLIWYPFTKNFSSAESLLYLNDALIFSPLELYIVLTLASWVGGMLARRKLALRQGPLFWPILVWAAFMAFGLVYGLGRGGSMNIGLWEARPMFYLPALFLLTTNLIETRAQVNRLMWCAMIAIFLHGGVAGLLHFVFGLNGEVSRIESIVEHSAAIRMNTLYVLAVAAWLYKAAPSKRILLPLFALPIFVTYMVAQRRASFVALGLALILIAALLFKENRRLFYGIAPPLAVIAVLYIVAFWNNQSPLGLPARAVKSIVASDAGNEQENSSNVYRLIENINNAFTIHTAPLTGVGFGNKFYIIVPLPDISFFAWWEYIVHNSMIWIWMKTGIGGFLSMLVMVGMSLAVGARTVWRMPGGDMSAIAATAALYVFMHFTYAYVDMSWDNQSMMYLGVMIGLLNIMEDVIARPVPPPAKRYPWQPDPLPAPGLRPL